jgi:hypothetical protein
MQLLLICRFLVISFSFILTVHSPKVEISDKRLDSEDERLLEDDLSEYSFK